MQKKHIETSFKSCGSCDDPECDFRRVIKRLKTSRMVPNKARKLDDVLLSFIYLALYILAFLLFIELSVGAGRHIYNEDTHSYLPIPLNCQLLFLEAVHRSRAFKKPPLRTSKFNLNKNVRKAKNSYSLLNSFQRSM